MGSISITFNETLIFSIHGSQINQTLEDVNSHMHNTIMESVIFAFTLGACSVLLFILLFQSPREKYSQSIFVCNIVSLFLLIIQSIGGLIINNALYKGIDRLLLSAFAQYHPPTWVPDIITSLAVPFLYFTILLSLILHVRAILSSESKIQSIVTRIATLAAVVEIVLVTVLQVFNILIQHHIMEIPSWLYLTIRIYFVIFVSIICLIYLIKLGFSIYHRRKNGMKTKYLDIIFIGFIHCLLATRSILNESYS